MKKLLCAVFALLFLLTACSSPAKKDKRKEAEPEPVTSGDYTYIVLEDGTAQILSYAGSDADLVIPAQIDGKAVASIGDTAFYSDGENEYLKKKLVSVTIPSGVTNIGMNAFCGCNALASAALPDTLKTIGPGAFAACGLTRIEIPASVETIGNGAFLGCPLETAAFSSDPVLNGNPFSSCEELAVVRLPEESAFVMDRSCLIDTRSHTLVAYLVGYGMRPGAKKMDIFIRVPDEVEVIGEDAFHWCKELAEVELPDGVRVIEKGAFNWCTKLARITIPASVTEINGEGYFAPFHDCGILVAAVEHGSFAETYCIENEIAVEYTE